MDFSNVYQKVENSIFNIGILKTRKWVSIGTGVLVKEGNKALTCKHCIIGNEQMYAKLSNNC